jgi:DNA-binding response OmpR family regulator
MVLGEGDPGRRRDHAVAIEADETIGALLKEVWTEFAIPGSLAVVEDVATGLEEINDMTSAVIIDVSNRFDDAISFIEKLRANDATINIPIFALSNFHGKEHTDPLEALAVQVIETPTTVDIIGKTFLDIQKEAKEQPYE